MPHSKGFTLIELMVTVAVLAIVITVAAPSFSNLLADNRASALANELQGALQLARSEAIKRRQNVTVCRSNAAQDDCADGTNWANGWLVELANGDILKVWDPASGATITGPTAGISFRSNGLSSSAEQWSVTPPNCSGQQRRTLSVNTTGSTSSTKGSCQ
ncbi:GspH/FimT family pseudopilin [Pseudomonas sp.]|uniref:GspH/FimT family pseudopilin n=1 Tax=Pseudomonas sp. TaxID=306 RepID=UPI003A9779E9